MWMEKAVRSGEWLELDWAALAHSPASFASPDIYSNDMTDIHQPRAGSHPHLVRQWLLARSMFPAKWINRLFSIGGIRWRGERLQLLVFAALEPQAHPLYRLAMESMDEEGPPVLYEDDYCFVLGKPAGMPVHESHQGEQGTLDIAAARHVLRQNDPQLVRHIHRLDDETSGPVLYSKNDLAQWKLDEAMREKRIDRHYIAVVQGRIKKRAATINEPIGKDRHQSGRRRVSAGGDSAITHYELVEASERASIVRVRLETGRTHQIRVHMSYIGHTLLGDALYGGDMQRMRHQALHGERLLFAHPMTGKSIEVHMPWPDWLEKLSARIRG